MPETTVSEVFVPRFVFPAALGAEVPGVAAEPAAPGAEVPGAAAEPDGTLTDALGTEPEVGVFVRPVFGADALCDADEPGVTAVPEAVPGGVFIGE